MVREKRVKRNKLKRRPDVFHGRSGGRKRGSKNKATILMELNAEKRIQRILASSKTPLEYMLRVMNDEKAPPKRRDKAARDAARYCHPALQAITRKDGTDIVPNFANLSDADLQAIANAKRLISGLLGAVNEAAGGTGTGASPKGAPAS